MKKKIRIVLFSSLILILTIGVYYSIRYIRIAQIGAGYIAKVLCSGIFISKREPEEILERDLKIPALDYFDYDINYEEKSVTTSILWGLITRKAFFLGEWGTVLTFEPIPNLFFNKETQINFSKFSGDANLEISGEFKEINYQLLDQMVNNQFMIEGSSSELNTKAILVLYKGKIIAEKYESHISEETRLCGWSMTKTFGNALAGVLVKKGFVKVDAPLNLSFWKNDSSKNKITLDNILRMSTGLEFEESYKKYDSDVMKMLYLVDDAAKYAAEKKLIHKPGTVWNYSSGTSNILAKFISDVLERNQIEPYKFVYDELLNKIGMNSSIVESDPSGTMLLSTGLFATAREWARFGKLYLHNGNWNDEQILPEWWIKYSTKATETSRFKKYGAHIWIKPQSAKKPEQWEIIKQLPDDLMYAAGHYGQFLFIVPSKDLIVVRLAQTYDSDAFNEFKFILDICNTINNNGKN